MIQYIRGKMNLLVDQHELNDRIRLHQIHPSHIERDPILLDKLQLLKQSFYTDRAQLVRWFEELELAYNRANTLDEGLPFSRLELHPLRLCANWKTTQCDFIAKTVVRQMLEAAKLKANGQPQRVPSEGYSTGYVLCAYFEQVLEDDIVFSRNWLSSRIREKHAALISLRRRFFAYEHPATGIAVPPTPSLSFLATLYGNPSPSFALRHAISGGLPPPPPPPPPPTPCPSPVPLQKEKSKPLQSMLAKRVLSYELERNGLRCPICLESESLSKESCIMFNCSHYVCEECYPSLEGRLCPMCRKQIKVSSD